jgi:hypothetical protein
MPFKVLTEDTQKVICHSNICSALSSTAPNLQLDPINRESLWNYVKFCEDSHGEAIDQTSDEDRLSPLSASSPSSSAIVRPIIDPADLIGRLFLKDQNNGECHCAHIVQLVEDHLNKAEGNPDCN